MKKKVSAHRLVPDDGISEKRVLVSPLDWGLGHATRLVPVINSLLEKGYRVILGGSGSSLGILKNEFPSLETFWLPSPGIRYSKSNSQTLSIFLKLPSMFFTILKEHHLLKKLIRTGKINMVISDNRYGLFSKDIYSIIITHQLSPVLPRSIRYLEYPVYMLIKCMTGRFDECWIPDIPGNKENFTGYLTRRYRLPGNVVFTGILSAPATIQKKHVIPARGFKHITPDSNLTAPEKVDILVILSGPEPHKTILLHKIVQHIRPSDSHSILIAGGFADPGIKLPRHISFIKYANALTMGYLIKNANVIICRPGYSVIMDLLAAGRTAILIPTPGQTEQEYLGRKLGGDGYFMTADQNFTGLAEMINIFRERSESGIFRKFNGKVNTIPGLPEL